MIQTTATIRSRGQLTIPDKIRGFVDWLSPDTIVSISVTPQQEVLIKPFDAKEVDWDDIWRRIHRSRSFKGKRGNLSKFIAQDRYNH